MRSITSFHYRLAHPGYSLFPGAHPGQMVGSGQLFKRHEPLLASPDPRRIDLRASLLDPFGDYRVRVFQQHSKLAMYAVADLSASMAGKMPAVADFVLSAAQSALETGDSFGFIGCGPNLERRWLLPAGQSMQAVREMTQRMRAFRAQGRADSLSQISPLLPARRSLLFLLSDWHFPLITIKRILQPLTPHAVVPLVVWGEAEYTGLPEWGLLRFKDAENGCGKTLLMRPELKRRIVQAFEQRKRLLRQTFRGYGMEPLFFSGAYRADLMTRYFQQHAL
ncbi:DUF58 domain-containing protein [Methylomonas sp. MgM2]